VADTARLRVLRAVAKHPPASVILAWSAAEAAEWRELLRDRLVRLTATPTGDELELTPLGVTYLEQLERATKPTRSLKKPNGGAS